MRQHLIQVVEDVFQELPLRARLDGGQQKITERAAVFQEENRKQGHDKEEPGLFGNVGNAQYDTLGDLGDVLAVADQK